MLCVQLLPLTKFAITIAFLSISIFPSPPWQSKNLLPIGILEFSTKSYHIIIINRDYVIKINLCEFYEFRFVTKSVIKCVSQNRAEIF